MTRRWLIRARGGDDIVAVADGERDLRLCGAGAVAPWRDRNDEVNPSCETVERR